MSEEKSELKDCPFCGSGDIEKRGRGIYAVTQKYCRICMRCKIESPEFFTSEAADMYWNNRAENTRIAELESKNFAQSDLIARLEKENADFRDWLKFFGIKILADGAAEVNEKHFEEWRKLPDENEKLEAEVERLKIENAQLRLNLGKNLFGL